MSMFYVTREAVKTACSLAGPDENATVDRLLEAASREVEQQLHRNFYPLTAVRYYPYPSSTGPAHYRYWLDTDLIEVTKLEAGGVEIVEADYYKEPVNYGPPYNRIELDLTSDAAWANLGTHQRAIEVTGRWGYCEVSAAAGALAGADEWEVTPNLTIDVTDSSLIGIGDLLLIGAERMVVTEKSPVTTTATVNMAGNIAAEESVVAITISDGTLVKQNEIIQIDAERMLVTAVTGHVLTVVRAIDASVLAAHNHGATLYAPRTVTVERAAVGTTATEHLIAAAISKNVPPGLIAELCLAEAIYLREQEKGHMALSVGQGDAEREVSGKGIADVRRRASDAYRRNRAPRVI